MCGSLRLKEKSCSQSAVLQFTKQAKLCVFFQLQHLHVNCEGQSKCSVCCFFLCVCVLLSLHLFLSLTSPFFHLFVNAPLLGAPKHAVALLPPVHMCVFRICLQQCTVLSPSLRVSHLHTKANSFFFFCVRRPFCLFACKAACAFSFLFFPLERVRVFFFFRHLVFLSPGCLLFSELILIYISALRWYSVQRFFFFSDLLFWFCFLVAISVAVVWLTTILLFLFFFFQLP